MGVDGGRAYYAMQDGVRWRLCCGEVSIRWYDGAQALHRLLVGVIVRVAMLGQPESALPPIAAEVTRTEAAFILGAQMSHLPALLSALGRALAYATSAEAAASGEEVMDEEALQIGSQCLGMAAGGGESALQAAAAKLDPRERGSWAV